MSNSHQPTAVECMYGFYPDKKCGDGLCSCPTVPNPFEIAPVVVLPVVRTEQLDGSHEHPKMQELRKRLADAEQNAKRLGDAYMDFRQKADEIAFGKGWAGGHAAEEILGTLQRIVSDAKNYERERDRRAMQAEDIRTAAQQSLTERFDRVLVTADDGERFVLSHESAANLARTAINVLATD